VKRPAGSYRFSPSDLINYVRSDFITWMDRFTLDRPGEANPDPDSEEMEILQRKGIEHEQDFLAGLKAAGRGVTPARITTLTNAINAFTGVMNLPRGQIVNRSTLLKEVDTDTADLLEQVADMDDLVLQFDGTDAGKRFIEAWKRARIIVDTGGGHSGTPPTPPTPPATPGK